MTKKLKEGQPEDDYKYIPLDDYAQHLYTFDLGAAASLVSAGFELVSLGKTNPRKVQFVFRREIGIEKVVDDYWADRLEVKARAFFDNEMVTKLFRYKISDF